MGDGGGGGGGGGRVALRTVHYSLNQFGMIQLETQTDTFSQLQQLQNNDA